MRGGGPKVGVVTRGLSAVLVLAVVTAFAPPRVSLAPLPERMSALGTTTLPTPPSTSTTTTSPPPPPPPPVTAPPPLGMDLEHRLPYDTAPDGRPAVALTFDD